MVLKLVPKITYLFFLKLSYALCFSFDCDNRRRCENSLRSFIPGAAIWVVGGGVFPQDPVATCGSATYLLWYLGWQRMTDVLGSSMELLTDFVGWVPWGYQDWQEALKMKREVVGYKIHNWRLSEGDLHAWKGNVLSVNFWFCVSNSSCLCRLVAIIITSLSVSSSQRCFLICYGWPLGNPLSSWCPFSVHSLKLLPTLGTLPSCRLISWSFLPWIPPTSAIYHTAQ